MSNVISKVRDWLTNFAKAREGNVAMMAGIALPVLLLVSAGAVDMHNFLRVKSELQDALDAASLAAARSPYTDAVNIQKVGMASMEVNMPQYYNGNAGDVATFTLGGKDKVIGSATVQVKTLIANTFLPPYGKIFDDYLPVTVNSEVMRASRNVEVAMALDVTVSMGTQGLKDLRDAANELIDIVVQTQQSPYTSKVALIPYGSSVNVGTNADAIRGSLEGPRNISSISLPVSNWITVLDNQVTVSGTSSSRRAVINTNTSNIRANTRIEYKYTQGGVQRTWLGVVSSRNNTSITVPHTLSAKGSSYSYRYCEGDCNPTVMLSSPYGLSNGDYVEITNSAVLGVSSAVTGTVSNVNGNSFVFNNGTRYGNSWSANNGTVQCGYDGCAKRIYLRSGQQNPTTLVSSTCVSERPWSGSSPSDASPLGAPMGRMYAPNSGTYSCLQPKMALTQLTSDRDFLKLKTKDFDLNGTTGGHIGVEMAWYALSPNFSSVFTQGPARPYNPSETIKAAIIMTDGEFNTPYCEGVTRRLREGNGIAEGILSSYYINCSDGGLSNAKYLQNTRQICDSMKDKGIVIYTVGFGFDEGEQSDAIDLLKACATSQENFHFTSSGTDLQNAFRAIGRDITRLRIAR